MEIRLLHWTLALCAAVVLHGLLLKGIMSETESVESRAALSQLQINLSPAPAARKTDTLVRGAPRHPAKDRSAAVIPVSAISPKTKPVAIKPKTKKNEPVKTQQSPQKITPTNKTKPDKKEIKTLAAKVTPVKQQKRINKPTRIKPAPVAQIQGSEATNQISQEKTATETVVAVKHHENPAGEIDRGKIEEMASTLPPAHPDADVNHQILATSSQNGEATGGENLRASARSSYASSLASWLGKYKQYPRKARRKNQQGVVLLEFTVDRSGRVETFDITGSSGYRLLDEEVEKMLLRASPLPAFPVAMTEDSMTITVPVTFRLN